MLHEGILYEKHTDETVKCRLCAHQCTIREGARGVCRVRENRDGTLISLVYGKLVAAGVDPVEKKPLYHFEPGTLSWSIATAGCNMWCLHCQNYQISVLAAREEPISGRDATPADVVKEALGAGCSSISYTYTEPTVFMEFARDCALEASRQGLTNNFVTNGYMSAESSALVGEFLDAANIDLKAANDEHYRKICGARLQPVLDTIESLFRAGVWIEITTLVIPGYNDDDASLNFIASFISSLNPGIPWHISKFFPTYRLTDAPPTPLETLERARTIGESAGLKYIYPGNAPGLGNDTKCPACGNILILRDGFSARLVNMDDHGSCLKCGAEFEGVLRKSGVRSPGSRE